METQINQPNEPSQEPSPRARAKPRARGIKMIQTIQDLRVLNAFKKYGLIFDKKFKYYLGDAYTTKTGLSTNKIFKHKNKWVKVEVLK